MELEGALEENSTVIADVVDRASVKELVDFHFDLAGEVDAFYLLEENKDIYIYIIEQGQFWFLVLNKMGDVIVETYKLGDLERISQKQSINLDSSDFEIELWEVEIKFKNEDYINLFFEEQSHDYQERERFKGFYDQLKKLA